MMEFRKFLTLIAFLAVAAMATRVSVASDTFWHLRAGEWIIENGQILREDPFSLTRFGEAWIYPGWVAQVLMISAFYLLGFPGLNLLTTAFVLLGFFFVWRVMEGGDFIRVIILLLAAVTSSVYWAARPHILTFALTGLFLWILEGYRTGKQNLLWMLPLGMVLWGNVHGGFASGFILIICYLLGEIIEIFSAVLRGTVHAKEALRLHKVHIFSYVGVGIISALSLSINPHGPRMILYPFMTVGIETLRDYIQEWQSPNFHNVQVYPFMFSVLLLLLVFAGSKKRITGHEYVLTAIYLILALTAARNIALYALVSAPVLTRHLTSTLEPFQERFQSKEELRPELARRLNLTIFALCAIAVGFKVAIPLSPAVNQSILRDQFPRGAIEFIEETEPAGPLFNSYNWGAYILWELYPDYPSFVDGRTDLFNDELLARYLSAWRGESTWEELLEEWEIKLALIEPQAPLRFQLTQSGWRVVYEDEQAVILTEN